MARARRPPVVTAPMFAVLLLVHCGTVVPAAEAANDSATAPAQKLLLVQYMQLRKMQS